MTGAEYIVEFLRQRGSKNFFLVQGGACAFIIDAIGRNKQVDYFCFNHEQSTAMAADACWRVNKTVGVTVATSGPGATNLITGIACSYFDSIPSIHITGQVNKSESSEFIGANVRQTGFQETKIVEMVKPITKYAVQVNSIDELKKELIKAYNIAISHRMGPVLIDVPMNIQKEEAGDVIEYFAEQDRSMAGEIDGFASVQKQVQAFLMDAKRPMVLVGAGIGLSGAEAQVIQFIEKHQLPFVSSWNGISFFDHDSVGYCGQIGVYGNRGANFILQNCDALLVLGSRLDNRQRSGNSKSFASEAKVLVVDVDVEELKKYKSESNFSAIALDLSNFSKVFGGIEVAKFDAAWLPYVEEMKVKYFGKEVSTYAEKNNTLSPYLAVKKINAIMENDAIVIGDTGATVCWVYQSFHRTKQNLFTSGGNSPMGYALPAAIGAKITDPAKQVICMIGDGGFQMNIQELQTVVQNKLDIKIVVFNNAGYGIIKQFQDSYFDSRYFATGEGYGVPDFEKIAYSYGIDYIKITDVNQLTKEIFSKSAAVLIDLIIDTNTLIEPKLEMGRPIHDQFPYISDDDFKSANRFVNYKRLR